MENYVIESSKVIPHWLPGGDIFWYQLKLPGSGHEFVLVNTLKATRQGGFTEDTLTQEVERLMGRWIDLKSLTEGDMEWNNPLDNANLKGRFLNTEVASPYAASEVSIRFLNRCSSPVTIEWIDHSCEPVWRGVIEVGKIGHFTTWNGHIWRIHVKEDPNSKVIYVAPKDQDKDAIVIDDNLLRGEDGARKSKNDTGFPQISIRNGTVWSTYENGDEQMLANNGSKTDLYDEERIYISPDRQFAVIWQYTPEHDYKMHLVESSPTEQLQPKMKSIHYLKPGHQVRVDRPRLFDLNQRKEIPTEDALFRNPYALTNVGWNKSGEEYRFIFNERGHQHLRVIGISVHGRVRVLVEENTKTFIDYSTKLYRHLISDTEEIIWASERDGWNHLYLYDLRQGVLKNQVTTGNWLVKAVSRVDEKTRQIWFSGYGMVNGQDPYYAQLARINFDGSGLTMLTDGNGTHSWKWSPDYRYLIDTWSRINCPPEVVLRDGITGAKILTLQESQLARLADSQWNAPEIFSTPGRDGITMIHGIIIRPANFDANNKYPILEEIYAGPQSYYTPKAFSNYSWYRGWADRGYVVVKLDGMGTNWRSKAFHDVCYKNIHDAGFPDRIKWIREAAVTRPWMDLERVGIMGTSAGGQSAGAALIHHGNFYKAAAADSGCHDNRMDKIWWNEQWMGWPVDKSYEDASNVLNAEKLQGNLMLIVGDLDDNVDPSSTFQFANALNKAGKIYEMLLIPGGKHGCGHGQYGQMRQADFFQRHLQKKQQFSCI
ncbi:Dipeptidyl aminopeptidase 4 [Trichoderma lentiforme]|uniref:Probable dipeptidyl-aminopeptidase B n=1 Tax=Trichoderma lentiforme TaxID=1567552 RepID=A0A9P4X2L0_9HYPO|nr:Dipeptidyl aminopeptidase 4 [Trichoderma lentiforme]